MRRKNLKVGIYIFTLALVIRLIFLIALPWDNDVIDSYDKIASHLLQEKIFSFNGKAPTVSRGPVYPAYLAVIMYGFGSDPVPYAAIRIIDCILDSLTAALIVWLCSLYFPSSTILLRILSSMLYALNPFIIWYTLKTGPETLSNLLLVLFMSLLGLVFFRGKMNRPTILALGIVSGILFLSKSIFIPFIILVIIAMFWLRPASREFRTVAAGLLVLVIAFTILAPWSFRATRTADRFVLVQTLVGFNFWYDFVLDENRNKAFGSGELNSSIIEENQVILNQGLPYRPYHISAKEDAGNDYALMVRALKWCWDHPQGFLLKIADNLAAFWYLVETPKKMIVSSLFSLGMILLAIQGYRVARVTEYRAEAALILLIPVILDLIYSPVIGMFRYSLNTFPFLSLLAGFAVWQVIDRLILRRQTA